MATMHNGAARNLENGGPITRETGRVTKYEDYRRAQQTVTERYRSFADERGVS